MNQEVEKLIEMYIAVRDDLKEIEKLHKENIAKHKKSMKGISGRLQVIADEVGTKSFKTDIGTAFKVVKDSIQVEDWNEVLPYLIENELTHMLTKSVAKAAAKEFMAENNDNLPPGLKYVAFTEFQVRKGKK